MKSTTSAALIGEVTRFFCDFGRPEVLESDNGTQFSSAEFREFCRTMGVQQVSSSPEFAQSNGLIERHVQTVKRTLLKMFADGKSLWDSLAAIRSTPVSSTLPAPSVLLQGRNLRGNLPFLPAELQPKYISSSVVRRELSARQSQAAFVQAGVPNARASSLHIGQPLRALIGRRWLRGKVHSLCTEPQSYVIRLDDGRYFRRTRWAINIDRGMQSQPRSLGSAAMFSYRVPSDVQSVQSANGCGPSSQAPDVPGNPVSEAPTPVRVEEQSTRAEPTTPSTRQSSNHGRVRTAASPGAQHVRLFDAPLSSAVAPSPAAAGPSGDSCTTPAREPFGTTRSGVRFGIGMPPTRK
ncbi:uncharacterized protein LOC123474170 [Daphnia magna]|uniref:uncharacterized protein LOC123474170 n=1 Tax=Daphnia magna TaxID=35525 RepID=UPI001E1BDCE9|nr:uncharacterized protein LOC123474170 [Daphnia magna]